MDQILIAFVTGLTTGGLSCLAVQGGLLASSLAAQVEQDLQVQAARRRRPSGSLAARLHLVRPILLFLLAKLITYTLLGAGLGALGSVLQFTPLSRGILQVAIGIFMAGSALRLFNVHPIFRFFSFEPPAALRRYIRKTARNGDGWVTPLFLGALTVFIPCGITQAMMALAVGSGNPLSGAAILFAFTLGTSPLFFAVSYLATRLGAAMERHFMRLVAAVLLVLGLISINSGLTLAGAPFAPGNLLLRLASPLPAPAGLPPAFQSRAEASQPVEANDPASPTLAARTGQGVVDVLVEVKNNGYAPAFQQAPAGRPIRLTLLTQDTHSCSRAFTIPELGVEQFLPASGVTRVDIPAQAAGKVLYYSCSMGMYGGAIQFN